MLFKGFLALILSLLLAFAISCILPGPSEAMGSIHSTFPSMRSGSASLFSFTQLKWLGFWLGFGFVLTFGICLLISLQGRNTAKQNQVWIWSSIGIVIYLLAYTVLLIIDCNTAGQPLALWAGFPVATAWMLFVFSIVPAYFTVLYVNRFRDWIMSDEDQAQFDAMINL